jgi:hypothetical protein
MQPDARSSPSLCAATTVNRPLKKQRVASVSTTSSRSLSSTSRQTSVIDIDSEEPGNAETAEQELGK